MKFVKENLTLVICGVVVLLVLVFAFAPIPYAASYWKDSVQSRMNVRYNEKTSIAAMETTSLELPPAPAVKGPPTPGWVDEKAKSIKRMNDEEEKVKKSAQAVNRRGRITADGVPILPLPTKDGNGKPEKGYLPKNAGASPRDFRADYGLQFKLWTGWLATGAPAGDVPAPMEFADASAPRDDKLKADYQALLASRQALTPGRIAPAPLADSREELEFRKRAVLNRASKLRMYVDSTAFQQRPWFTSSDDAPSEQQIFEALADSWIQSDIVKSIVALNTSSIGSPTDAAISKSAVKRLIHVTVGNAAKNRLLGGTTNQYGGTMSIMPVMQTDPGPLFYTVNSAGNTGGPGGQMYIPPVPVNPGDQSAAAAAQTVAPNAINYDLSMTGQSGGADYDVVLFSVWMDIDPSKLTAFEDELARHNMYITLVDHLKTVDPLDRVSNGYLYGDGQVVEVEMQAEAIFFRSWTLPLMPDDEKRLLSIPLQPQ